MVLPICADTVLGMVGAMIDFLDWRSFRAEACAHPFSKRCVCGFVEYSATDPGLVTNHNDGPTGDLNGKPRQGENARDKFELFDRMDVAVINIDHAVAVEK